MAAVYDFDATENAVVEIPPFRDVSTGDVLTGDTVTLVIKKPSGGSALTQASSGVTLASQDADTHYRKLTLAQVTIYDAGDWTIEAVSDDANAKPVSFTFKWGTGVAEKIRLTSADGVAALSALLGTPVGASIAADIAAALAASLAAQTSADLANMAATAAGVQATTAATQATAAAATAEIVRKIQTNRYKIVGTTLVIYDDNGTTPYKTFNLFDDVGTPSSTRIFERVPI